MIRKITLVFLFFVCMYAKANAAAGDSVTIQIPIYTDTTCVGTQLQFTATDTFTGATIKWYANNVFTGVSLDTFYTTALNDGDSVFCWLYLTATDSTRSNAIVIHHAASIPARVLTAITVGSNPDCAGHAVTFTAYPVNGGTNPTYQWYINGTEVTGSDSVSITRIFGGADTVSCRMVSNSPCAPVDTVYSIPVPIIHIHLTESVSISAFRNPVCQYTIDTITATAVDYGSGVTYQWYLDTMAVPGAVNYQYTTDSLHTGDSVYCIITSLDTCVLNPVTKSNVMTFTVYHTFHNFAHIILTQGTNPYCFDSVLTFTAVIDSFGAAPNFQWYINGVPTAFGSDTLHRQFNNNDLISFSAWNYAGCYTNDSINVPAVIMILDTISASTPLLSLIGDNLVTNNPTAGFGVLYRWYYNTVNSYTGATLLTGVTDSAYHPTLLGYYYCVAQGVNCPSTPSNIIYISLLGIKEVNKYFLTMYPNPTSGNLNLDWGTYKVSAQIEIYNTVGQSVYHDAVVKQSTYNADLSALPTGNYYIVMRDEQGNYDTRSIEIQRK